MNSKEKNSEKTFFPITSKNSASDLEGSTSVAIMFKALPLDAHLFMFIMFTPFVNVCVL